MTADGYARRVSAEYAARQAVEWGTYIAARPLFIGGVLAFNPGDAVPVSHVERFGWEQNGLVSRIGELPSRAGADSSTRVRPRLMVLCGRRVVLRVYEGEPAELVGNFAGRRLMLDGEHVTLAPRADLMAMGKDPRTEPTVADAVSPLHVSCHSHSAGHELAPALLRSQLRIADRAPRSGKVDPSCSVASVSHRPSPASA
jgi:hypothetical protein